MTNIKSNETGRILAEGFSVSNDTWKTHLNNNDLIIGTSGAGKTRTYVKPNLLQCEGSFVVTDTKGLLLHEVGPVLERRGYRIWSIDFDDPDASDGFNPLDQIGLNPVTGEAVEADVRRLAKVLIPEVFTTDPFWDEAACQLLIPLLAYTVTALPEGKRTIGSVVDLVSGLGSGRTDEAMGRYAEVYPDSPYPRLYRAARVVSGSEKTDASIQISVTAKLAPLCSADLERMYSRAGKVDLAEIGRQKTALFLKVSDSDRSMDPLVNLVYTQALQALMGLADSCEGGRLPVPVRLYLDDFATNCVIPDFDGIISVIRSRDISVSVVLQSLTQLSGMYGYDRAMTVVNNCDHALYLGGMDLQTVDFVCSFMDCPRQEVLGMPVDKLCLIEKGVGAQFLPKYHLEEHPLYGELPEARRSGASR